VSAIIRPCPTHVKGCPCINDNPFANLSSEAPDPADVIRMVYVGADPDINSPEQYWDTPIGLGSCSAPTSQEALDCAAFEGYVDTHLDQPTFRSRAQFCGVPCPDGTLFTYSLPAGAITAATQVMADYLALSVCTYRAQQARRCAPAVVTTAATNVDDTTATLTGTVNPNGSSTSYFFQWGKTTAYGNITPVTSVGAGKDTLGVFADIDGLTPGTTYHYRIVGISANGTSFGADASFQTITSVTPLAWWKMEEAGAGDRIDIIGGIHLTPQVILGAVARGAGKVNFGVELSGVGAPPFPVDVAFQNTVDTFPYIAADGMDITFWVNDVTFVNGSAVLLLFVILGNPLITLQLDAATGLLTLDLAFVSSVSIPFPFGGWKLIRIFVDPDAGTLGMQINNGVPTTLAFVAAGDSTSTNYIFSITASNNLLPNTVDVIWDELAIWPRLLTAAEFDTIWNGGAGRTWPF